MSVIVTLSSCFAAVNNISMMPHILHAIDYYQDGAILFQYMYV